MTEQKSALQLIQELAESRTRDAHAAQVAREEQEAEKVRARCELWQPLLSVLSEAAKVLPFVAAQGTDSSMNRIYFRCKQTDSGDFYNLQRVGTKFAITKGHSDHHVHVAENVADLVPTLISILADVYRDHPAWTGQLSRQ